ncbi:MAG: S8 family serine peptidase [Clostridiales bacterium]|nr:S8 family serine peptidase [Clostridiales bacterium]
MRDWKRLGTGLLTALCLVVVMPSDSYAANVVTAGSGSVSTGSGGPGVSAVQPSPGGDVPGTVTSPGEDSSGTVTSPGGDSSGTVTSPGSNLPSPGDSGASGQVTLEAGASYYQYQWGLNNTGIIQRISSVFTELPIRRMPGERIWRGSGLHIGVVSQVVTDSVEGVDINVEPAWDYYQQTQSRRTVTVALIDTGVDITHTDLTDAIWVNEDEIPGDGIDNDGNGYIDDVNGWNFYSGNNQVYVGTEDDHGTHGAGTIAAAWDGKGTVGIADSSYVKIMVLKALGSADSSGDPAYVKEAIRYAEANGADICNLSMGTLAYDEELEALIRDSSMLFVIAAGNGDYFGNGYDIDTWPMYPASYTSDNIISVANLMFNGALDESSNYGAVSVDIAAPGTYILSTTPGQNYSFMSGTSMAAPMVTGVAALVYSCRTDMTLADVRQAILFSARTMEGMNGKTVTGGILDAYGAITYGRSS